MCGEALPHRQDPNETLRGCAPVWGHSPKSKLPLPESHRLSLHQSAEPRTHLPPCRLSPAMTLVIFAVSHPRDFRMQLSVVTQQRQQTFVREHKRSAQRHRARAGPCYHAATHTAHFFDPRRELARVADGRGEQKQAYSWGRQDDRFFPDMPAIFVGKIMCFVEHD